MAGGQLGMVVIVWAFSFVSGVFGFEEEASAFKVSSQDKRLYSWRHRIFGHWLRRQQRRSFMENIRDLAYEGWMSKTSRKGKGSGKNKGRAVSGEEKTFNLIMDSEKFPKECCVLLQIFKNKIQGQIFS